MKIKNYKLFLESIQGYTIADLLGADVELVKLYQSFQPNKTAEEIDADKKAWRVHTEKYQQICGSAIFCNNVCRLDIAYAVGALTKYMHNPGPAHMEAAMDLARYLAGIVELGIVFSQCITGLGVQIR
jgi:hypothetical protein